MAVAHHQVGSIAREHGDVCVAGDVEVLERNAALPFDQEQGEGTSHQMRDPVPSIWVSEGTSIGWSSTKSGVVMCTSFPWLASSTCCSSAAVVPSKSTSPW